MTYKVFGGTLSLTQSVNQYWRKKAETWVCRRNVSCEKAVLFWLFHTRAAAAATGNAWSPGVDWPVDGTWTASWCRQSACGQRRAAASNVIRRLPARCDGRRSLSCVTGLDWTRSSSLLKVDDLDHALHTTEKKIGAGTTGVDHGGGQVPPQNLE